MLQREHSAILSTFIKLPVVIKTFVLFIFEWLFYTGLTVRVYPPHLVAILSVCHHFTIQTEKKNLELTRPGGYKP